MKKEARGIVSILDDILMIVLALASAGILIVEYALPLPSATVHALDMADVTIAFVFLFEFCVKFFSAKKKGAYFKSHWWELLASIPVTTPTTQALRLLRLLRLTRLLRLNEGISEILDYLNRFVKQTHAIGVVLVWLLIAFGGAGAFFAAEHMAHPQPLTYFDCVWWAVSTMTTVGYGDVYPLTTAGRIVAMLLMVSGIGATGTFTALIASFFLKENK